MTESELIEHLQEQLAFYKSELGLKISTENLDALRARYGTTTMEGRFIMVLYNSRRLVAREHILNALYGDDPDEQRAIKIVDVYACKIRDRIGRRGLITTWGLGYSLSAAMLKELDALFAQAKADPGSIERVPPRDPKRCTLKRGYAQGRQEVLLRLAVERGPISLTDMAGIIGVPYAIIHATLRELQRKGYVYVSDQRRRSPTHKSMLNLWSATDLGKEVYKEVTDDPVG